MQRVRFALMPSKQVSHPFYSCILPADMQTGIVQYCAQWQ